MTVLDLSSNEIHKIDPVLFSLPQLQSLNLSKNMLTQLPATDSIQCTLSRLDLSSNYFRDIPYIIQNFPNLSYLNISYNKDLSYIPPWLASMENLEDIRIEGLPNIEGQLQGKSAEVFMQYLKTQYETSRRIYEMKMVVTGIAGAGKTLLVSKFNDRSEVLASITGRGINIFNWSYKLSDKSKEYEYVIWDMGGCGQPEVDVKVEEVFYTPYAFYVLVFNAISLEESAKEIEERLSLIYRRGSPSCVLFVGTHIDLIDREIRDTVMEVAEKFFLEISSKFPNLLFAKPIVQLVSLIDDLFDFKPLYDSIFKLSSMLYCTDSRQPYMGRNVLLSAVGLKGEIEEYSRQIQKGTHSPVLTYKDLEEIVSNLKDAEVRSHDELLCISQFLNQVGCLVCFTDINTSPVNTAPRFIEVLKDSFFMDPDWLIDKLRAILTEKTTSTYCGLYHRLGLQQLLVRDAPNNEVFQGTFLEAVLSVLVCFKLLIALNESWYINTSLLPEELPLSVKSTFDSTQFRFSQQYVFKKLENWIEFLTAVLINVIPLSELAVNEDGLENNQNDATFICWKKGALWSKDGRGISLELSFTDNDCLLKVSYTSESVSLIEGVAEMVEQHLTDAVVSFTCTACKDGKSNQPCTFTIQDCLNSVISDQQMLRCSDGHFISIPDLIPFFFLEPTHSMDQLNFECSGTKFYSSISSHEQHFKGKYRGRNVLIIKYQSISETVLRQVCLKSLALKKFNSPFLTNEEGRLLALALTNKQVLLICEVPTLGKLSNNSNSEDPVILDRLVLCRVAVQLAKALLSISCTLPSFNISFWSFDITSLIHCSIALSSECLKKLSRSPTAPTNSYISNWVYFMKNLYTIAESKCSLDLYYMSKLFKSSLSLESVINIFSSVYFQLVANVHLLRGLTPPLQTSLYTGCSSLVSIVDLWMCSLNPDKNDIRIGVYSILKQATKVFKVGNISTEILAVKVCSDHVWLSTQLPSDMGSLSVFNASTREFVHNIKMKGNSITCIEWTGTEVCVGTKAGFVFVFPDDIYALKKGDPKPRHKFIGDGTVTGLAYIKDQHLSIAQNNQVILFDHKEMKFISLYESSLAASDLIGRLFLTSDQLKLYSVQFGGTVVREWSTTSNKHICTINIQEAINCIGNDDLSLQQHVVTAFTVSLDTLWIGLSTGLILIYSSNEFITWVRPYLGTISFLLSFINDDNNYVISCGESYQSPIKNDRSDFSNSQMLITFRGYSKETLQQLTLLQESRGEYLNSFESVAALLNGRNGFKDIGMIVNDNFSDNKSSNGDIVVQIPDKRFFKIPTLFASTIDSLLELIQSCSGISTEGYDLVYHYKLYDTFVSVSSNDELNSYLELSNRPLLKLMKL